MRSVLANIFFLITLLTAAHAQPWTATTQKNGQITLEKGKSTLKIQPSFYLLSRADDPDLQLPLVYHISYRVPSWKERSGDGRSSDIFRAATPVPFKITQTTLNGGRVDWTFATTPGGTLTAWLDLTEKYPLVRWSFRAATGGYHAVVFAPYAPQAVAGLSSLWQPMIWQERRMPDSSYVSAEFMSSIPMTVAARDGRSRGVAVHPAEIPYRMPNFGNSRFGLLLRNAAGQAQPMVMAPLFGQKGTFTKAGAKLTFAASIIDTDGEADQAFQQVARELYDFHDYRQNGTCSLNETLHNMIRFAMDDRYSHWVADLRGSDYVTDVKGTVKNVSALHPLTVAVVTDDEEVFRQRAVPMTEYMLSREKYLFSRHDGEESQSPSHFLRGPAAEVSELGALHAFAQGNSSFLGKYAIELSGKTRRLNLDMPSEADSWQNLLALYRVYGTADYLERAKQKALDYIEKRITTTQTDFSDALLNGPTGGQFWTDFAPKWIDLLELYEASGGPANGDKRFLDAARQGAAYYAMYAWVYPTVPPGLTTVHEGDSIPMYYRNRNLSPQARPYPVREQQVPAWRVSNVGLTPEASTTYVQNPAVLLAHYAAYMLRLAQYTGEGYFRDVARSAVVGRYANFPGYDINYQFTTLNQHANYPYHDTNQFTYNQFFFNHIWPNIALVLDYLVADVSYKSKGAIHFPGQYAQGYAFLQSKVFGAEKGEFYGDKNVSIWLPDHLLKSDNEQINYLAAYGNGNTYLALTNQSADRQAVTVRLNPDVLRYDAGKTYAVKLFMNNQPAGRAEMKDGRLTTTLDGHGIAGFVIEGLAAQPTFQQKLKPLPELADRKAFTEIPMQPGKLVGMLLSWGEGLHNAYLYLTATEKDLTQARLHYSLDGQTWKTETDMEYPFEFSIPLTDAQRERGFSFRVETVGVDRKVVETEEGLLR